MNLSSWCGRVLAVGVVAVALSLTGPSWADEEQGPKGPPKGEEYSKGRVIQIDLNKLPPDLAKQVLKYAADTPKGPPKAKPAPAAPAKEPAGKGFGQFVRSQVAKGLRGTSLAEAIHKEQARRGMKTKPDLKKPGTESEVDLDKLPPDLAKRLQELSRTEAKKADVKAISLGEAMAIAEKAGSGQAIKAERKGEGTEIHFRVDVLGKDGIQIRVEVDASGKVLDATKEPPKVPPGKGKGLQKKPV